MGATTNKKADPGIHWPSGSGHLARFPQLIEPLNRERAAQPCMPEFDPPWKRRYCLPSSWSVMLQPLDVVRELVEEASLVRKVISHDGEANRENKFKAGGLRIDIGLFLATIHHHDEHRLDFIHC